VYLYGEIFFRLIILKGAFTSTKYVLSTISLCFTLCDWPPVRRLFFRDTDTASSATFDCREMQTAFNGAAAKAAPTTGTTPANASGILDASPNSVTSRDQQGEPRLAHDRDLRPRASIHSYCILLLFHLVLICSGKRPGYIRPAIKVLPRLVCRGRT
jgi:hypothetical protein